jgi:hypothetical protein
MKASFTHCDDQREETNRHVQETTRRLCRARRRVRTVGPGLPAVCWWETIKICYYCAEDLFSAQIVLKTCYTL